MKIIQITDTHLFADNERDIFGVKSNLKFEEVMNKVIAEDCHDTDMIFLTGDISQDETAESYQLIIKHLSKLNIPVYWIPGNHDDLDQMETIFKQVKNFNRANKLSFKGWHFIFLNTKIAGREDGELTSSELNRLREELISCPISKKIAIVMHHHPTPVGTPLIDNYILKNSNDFWSIVTGTKVDLIICGHIHGDYRFKHNNITIESSPATCLQWKKGTKDLKIDMKIGYKTYHFDHDTYKSITKMW